MAERSAVLILYKNSSLKLKVVADADSFPVISISKKRSIQKTLFRTMFHVI